MSILEEAKKRFKQSADHESENRDEAYEDLKFARLGEQWPEGIEEQRNRDGRPCLTINRLPAFIRQVVNDARLNKPAISVHAADSNADPETAEIFSGLIRNIEANSNASAAYIGALESAVTSGFGYFRISMDYAYEDVWQMDILVERVANPFTVYGDPNGEKMDGSDWRYCFVAEWQPREVLKQKYPKAELPDWSSTATGDNDTEWYTQDEARICEYWKKIEEDKDIVLLSNGVTLDREQYEQNIELFMAEGIVVVKQRTTKTCKIKQYILSGNEILEENDWPGRYIPIIPVYGEEVVADGYRHFRSLVRDVKDAQRMYNYWRSTQTEEVALRPKVPFIGPVGFAETDAEKWATANTETHAYLEYDGQIPPQRSEPASPAIGAIQEALASSNDLMDVMGIHQASLGMPSNETSGRAIMARQREGDVGTFHFVDNLSRSIRHAGCILVDLIPKVYDEPRIVRVLGEDDEEEAVQVNQPMEDGTIYDLTNGKYDVTVRSGPSFTSRREEAATQMIELLRNFPQAAPLVGDLLAKNLDWPGADEIAKRLKAMLPPQVQDESEIPVHIQQQIEQGKQFIGQLQEQLGALQSQIQNKTIEKEIKQIEAQVKMKEAEVGMLEQQVKLKELAVREREADVDMKQANVDEGKVGLEAGKMGAEIVGGLMNG